MGLVRKLVSPETPVIWTRRSPEDGELEVYCIKGWQTAEVTNEDILKIEAWLHEHPEAKEFNLTVGTGVVQEQVMVDKHAMPFFRAVVEAVAQEIAAAEPEPKEC